MSRFTLALLVVLAPALARADLPPPADKKFVSYGFRVENVKAFPDYVVLAFPWSLSGGAPTKEHALVEDAKTVALGRRSSVPELYAMKKSEYETWKASYKPTHEFEDKALDELFASKKVIRCNAKLTPEFMLDKKDPRTEVLQAFRVESIDAQSCKIAALDAKATTPVATAAAADTPAPSPPATTPASPTPPSTTPNKAGGCGGCATPAHTDHSSLGWLVLALSALVLRRRSH
jgi:hypothetical protein